MAIQIDKQLICNRLVLSHKVWNKATYNWLTTTIMQVAVSSVNSGLNLKSSLVKNSMDVLRSFTGKFTKIWVGMSFPFDINLTID